MTKMQFYGKIWAIINSFSVFSVGYCIRRIFRGGIIFANFANASPTTKIKIFSSNSLSVICDDVYNVYMYVQSIL